MGKIIVSAPGKVLLTGGYLILDKKYSGAVVTVSTRFYTDLKFCENSAKNNENDQTVIRLKSPQISNNTNVYRIFLNDNSELSFKPEDPYTQNLYIESCLKFSLLAISCFTNNLTQCKLLCAFSQKPEFKLYGDNQFYSTDENNSINSASSLKTGLGSSASLTSSFVTALMLFLNSAFNLKLSPFDLKLLSFRIALFAHSFAQGKLGSGFDITAAFFGSVDFRMGDYGMERIYSDKPDSFTKSEFFRFVKEFKTIDVLEPFVFPPCFALMLGNIRSGSSTPKMVRKVMQYVSSNPNSSIDIFESINKNNLTIRKLFSLLSVRQTEQTKAEAADEKRRRKENNVFMEEVKTLFLRNRRLYKELGVSAGVEIEPDFQTKLLDETSLIPGVIAACVPGAGGCDAVYAITIKSKSVADKVEALWKKHRVFLVETQISGEGIKIDCFFSFLTNFI